MTEKPSGAASAQADIDALLGDMNGPQPQQDTPRTALEVIVEKAISNYESLPMLDVVSERFSFLLPSALRQYSSVSIDVDDYRVMPTRFGEALDTIPLPVLVGVVNAREWDSQILLAMEAPLIYGLVDILLGGRKNEPSKADGRAFTKIERRLIEKVMNLVLESLSDSFGPMIEINFEVDRLETNPQFATVSQKTSPSTHMMLNMSFEDRQGVLHVIMPHNAFEPVRKTLSQMFVGDKFGADSRWQEHLETVLMDINVVLQAVHSEFTLPAKDIMTWKVGDTINLPGDNPSLVTIYCRGKNIMAGELGHKNGMKAVSVLSGYSKKNLIKHS